MATTPASESRSRSTTVGDTPIRPSRATSLRRAQDLVGPVNQAISSRHERLVLGRGGECGEQPGSLSSAPSQIGQ